MEWKVVSPLQQSNLHNLLLDEVCDSFPGRRDLFAKPFPVTDESGAVWTEIRELKGNTLRKNSPAVHNKYTASPAAPGSGRSCKRWADPPGWRKPRFLRLAERCRWTRPCTGPSSRRLPGGCKPWGPCRRSSHMRRCSTGKATRARPALCACRWRSSPADWCRISIVYRLSRKPSLWRTDMISFEWSHWKNYC